MTSRIQAWLRQPWDADRIAAWVFGAYLLAAFAYCVHRGADSWFSGDEWQFLVNKHSVGDMLRPQNGHWSTTPIVVYQFLSFVFSLQSYMPFLVVLVAMHLALATLIRVALRMSGVRGWLATVVAGSFVLFGPGEQNILQAVQISMVATMLAGFGQMLLAQHDGGLSRRDVFAVAVGAVGLMSSGIGPPMAMVVGVAVLVRRGWLVAAAHTAPLAALYVGWFLAFNDSIGFSSGPRPPGSEVAAWISTGMRGVFVSLGQFGISAAVLAGAFLAGMVLAAAGSSWPEIRRHAAIPIAGVIGAPLLFAVISTTRWLIGSQAALSSRYISMATAMALPAIGYSFEHLTRRFAPSGYALSGILLLAFPTNITLIGTQGLQPAFFEGQRELAVAIGRSPLARQVPTDSKADRNFLGLARVPTGFLVEAWDDSMLPGNVAVSPKTDLQVVVRLGFEQRPEPAPTGTCDLLTLPFTGTLPPGTVLRMVPGNAAAMTGAMTVAITGIDADGTDGESLDYGFGGGSDLRSHLPTRRWRITTPTGGTLLRCAPPS